jgi:ABC-type nitrate/sulfonate/bicarbonate transport system substrate-binding protein
MTHVPQVGTMFSMYIGKQGDAAMTIILGKAIIGKGRPSNFFGMDTLGMAEPTFAWMVTPDYLRANEGTLRTFLRATYEAVAVLNENPKLAVEPFLANVPGAKAEAVLEDYHTVLSYQCAPGEKVVGRMSDDAWKEAAELYKSVGQISKGFDVTKIYTNKLFDTDSVSSVRCPQ